MSTKNMTETDNPQAAILWAALATCEANAGHFESIDQPVAAEYQRQQAAGIRAKLDAMSNANTAAPILVKNRFTAYMAAVRCRDAGLTIAAGRNVVWVDDECWGWSTLDILEVAQNNSNTASVRAF